MNSTRSIKTIDDVGDIVDTDIHTSFGDETMMEALSRYMPEPFDDFLKPNKIGNGVKPSAAYLRPSHYSDNQRRSLSSPSDIRSMMEELNTDQAILVGGPLRLGLIHHEELGAAIAQAYNDWMLDTFLDEIPGCYGAAMVQPQIPDLAVEEIRRRADESKIVGIFIPSGGITPPLGRKKYFPIYEAAEDAGLPVLIHGAVTGPMSTFTSHWQGTKRYLDMHTVGFPLEVMFHVSNMLTNGVPVRYPDLDFVIQETGLGWIPYFMRRYDAEYSTKRPDAPLLEKTPSEYIRDRFYFTSQPAEGLDDPTYIEHMIRFFGGEQQLLFSSDYPHHDFDYPEQFFRTLRSRFTDEEIESIYRENARRIFEF